MSRTHAVQHPHAVPTLLPLLLPLLPLLLPLLPLLLLLPAGGPGSWAANDPEPPAARAKKPPGLLLPWCTLMLQRKQQQDTMHFMERMK
jgi:hypothetical protein